ncbi:MAG: hypothetical protein NC918_00710 [Candidatus Omnitrophica bacterium]|nr:hypothetical protein [Candidatus Omnitrophota bacterium]
MLELAKRLSNFNLNFSAKKGIITFHNKMLENGFSLVNDKFHKENELIYNRAINHDGTDNGKSNFFVFVKIKPLYCKIFFFNPDYSQEAYFLKPNEIYQNIYLKNYTSQEINHTIKKIIHIANKKPNNSYFILLHSHVGYINGVNLLEKHLDDGQSDQLIIIRQLMLHHYDIDASGMHNNFIPSLFIQQQNMEKQVGIIKVPSIEITLPLNKRAANGPHEIAWFSSVKDAIDYHNYFFKERVGKYPPYATTKSLKKY